MKNLDSSLRTYFAGRKKDSVAKVKKKIKEDENNTKKTSLGGATYLYGGRPAREMETWTTAVLRGDRKSKRSVAAPWMYRELRS
jgi:hypothetical protein